jgi:hypothetical protein
VDQKAVPKSCEWSQMFSQEVDGVSYSAEWSYGRTASFSRCAVSGKEGFAESKWTFMLLSRSEQLWHSLEGNPEP